MIVAIVQARMGSTRLPGKALLDIEGEPMLARVVNRLRRANTIDKVVVATTTKSSDDGIVDFCQSEGIPVHRGPEDDVLTRYLQAAEAEEADVVVRVTSDCPLIDPALVDLVVDGLGDADYVANVMEPRTFPRGLDVEAFTLAALRQASLKDRSRWREHVTPFIYSSGEFQCNSIVNDEDLHGLRWTVDTLEDMNLARAIYRHFGHDMFTWKEVLGAWNSDWARLNEGIRQKET